MNVVAALAGDGKRCAELPAVGDFQRCCVIDLVGFPSFGIKQNLIPTDHCKLRSGGGAGGESAFESGRREEVEFRVDLGNTLGNFDMDGESVEQIAAPLQRLAARAELQAGKIGDGSVGRMLTRDPFWIVKGEVTGSSRDR